jgi:hypothetical protein
MSPAGPPSTSHHPAALRRTCPPLPPRRDHGCDIAVPGRRGGAGATIAEVVETITGGGSRVLPETLPETLPNETRTRPRDRYPPVAT